MNNKQSYKSFIKVLKEEGVCKLSYTPSSKVGIYLVDIMIFSSFLSFFFLVYYSCTSVSSSSNPLFCAPFLFFNTIFFGFSLNKSRIFFNFLFVFLSISSMFLPLYLFPFLPLYFFSIFFL